MSRAFLLKKEILKIFCDCFKISSALEFIFFLTSFTLSLIIALQIIPDD